MFLDANNGSAGEAFLQPTAGSTLTIDTGVLVHGRGIVGRADGTLINLGTIQADVAGNTLTLQSQAGSNAGTLSATTAGTLAITGTWSYSGILAIAEDSLIDVTGDLALESGSLVEIQLGGTGLGQFSRFNASGQMTFDGTLDVTTVNGFSPSAGETFEVSTHGSSSGSFSTVNGDVGGGLMAVPLYGATNLTLEIQ